MHLLSKLISAICPKIGDLDGKTEQNRLKVRTLPPFFFFQKKPLYFLKNDKHLFDYSL